MSVDAVRLVADVLRQHEQADEWGYPVEECRCNATFAGDYADHVAAVVVAALGGLTREHGRGNSSDLARWVSGWTPEETHQ